MPNETQNFSPKPDESKPDSRDGHVCLRTTGEVVTRLERLNLPASIRAIARDTHEHYLPSRDTHHAGRGGNSGLWEPWMERRAERLYRLRALDRRTKRGPNGDVLRLLLFLHDGWGFEFVKEACVEGYRRLVRLSTRGVDNRVRNGQLTLENVPFNAEDVAADQYRPSEPTREQIQRIEFTLNMTLFGIDTGSGMGTLDSIVGDILQDDVKPDEFALAKNAAPFLHSMMDLSEANVLRCADNAEPETLKRAALEFRDTIYFSRRMFHTKFGSARDGGPPSSNPLSMFGMAARASMTVVFRKAPVRMTPAQVLGGQFLVILAGVRRMEELNQWASDMLPMLPAMMKAALGEQAPEQSNSEIEPQE
jgi:hypothetical protein